MCRSLAEGGRRCPHQGYSSGRANQAARQQLSRARRRLAAAEAAGDAARITKAQAQVTAAQARVDGSKPADTAPAPAGTVRVVEQTRTGAPAHKPSAAVGSPASAPVPAALPLREEEAADQQVETSIRDAYRAALADRGDPHVEWVDLADLRARLPKDIDRATVDRVLDKMIESPDVSLQHELVQRSLTPERRDAAVVIGGEPRHLIALAGGRAARLAEATSREEAADLLRGLTKKELAQVAATYNQELPARMRKADQIDLLYQSVQDGMLAHGVRPPSSTGHKTEDAAQVGDRVQSEYSMGEVTARTGQASREAKTTARPSAKAITPTSEHVADAVAYLQWGAKRREEAAAALAGLTKKELAQVAGALDTPLKAGKKADQLNQLVEDIASARIDRPAAAPKSAGRQAGMPRRTREEKQASPHQESKPAVVQMAGPPVSGWPSDKPLLENNWGGVATSPVHYHDDGPVGMAVKYMGADKRMSIDGEPLANVLGILATDVHRGRRTPQEGLDAMKELRDRLPDGSRARQSLESAIWKIDAPRGPSPVVPDSTPEPLRKLVHELHDIPVVRAQPDREMEPLLRIINDVAAGRARYVDVEISRLAGRRHESYGDSGYRQIKDAINAAREGYNNYVREQKRKQT